MIIMHILEILNAYLMQFKCLLILLLIYYFLIDSLLNRLNSNQIN